MNPLAVVLLVIAVVACLLLILFCRVVRSTDYSAQQTFFWLIARCLTRCLWRAKIEDPFPITGKGNAVIICNHRSSIDPFFIQVSLKRVVHWMVAREFCEHPILGRLLKITQVIPVNRGGIDTASIKAAIRLVAAGGMVGMLPEGRINMTDEFMRPVRPGAVMIALRGRAPIVPCFIDGAPYGGSVLSPFFRRADVRVRFGAPIDLSPYYGREKDSDLVRHLLVQCVAAIAALAGQEDFEPQVAGRKWKSDNPQSEPDEQ